MENRGIIEAIRAVLIRHGGLVGAYLFGSRAGGECRSGSDVDVGVLFDKPLSLNRVLSIQNELENAVELPVDVIDLRTAGPFLALDIIRGSRFLCADDFRCDEFELFVLRRAGDLAPFERQRRAALLGMTPQ